MKMLRLSTLSIALSLLSLLSLGVSVSGCNARDRVGTPGRTTDGGTADGSVDPRDAGGLDGTLTGDAGARIDGSSEPAVDGDTTSRCAHDGFPRAFSRTRADGDFLQYSAIDNLAGDPTTVLQVQRFYSLGAARSDSPQFVTLRDESYADCTTCVLVYYRCTLGATVYDVSACDKMFLARAGSLELTMEGSASGELLGFFHDVELVEVEIAPDTYATTVVPGGDTWCIPSFTFEDEVIDPAE